MPDDKTPDPQSESGFRDAIKRSMMVGCAPESLDEVLMLADALRVWTEHPELRNEIVVKLDVDPRRMLMRVAMVVALIKFSGPVGADVEGYEPEEPTK